MLKEKGRTFKYHSIGVLTDTKSSGLPKIEGYCIYFLLLDGSVVYIGQTKQLSERVYAHREKVFNSVRFFECDSDKLNEYETRWIAKFNPVYNKATKGSVYRGPKKEQSGHVRSVYFKNPILWDYLETSAKAQNRSVNNYFEMLVKQVLTSEGRL